MIFMAHKQFHFIIKGDQFCKGFYIIDHLNPCRASALKAKEKTMTRTSINSIPKVFAGTTIDRAFDHSLIIMFENEYRQYVER